MQIPAKVRQRAVRARCAVCLTTTCSVPARRHTSATRSSAVSNPFAGARKPVTVTAMNLATARKPVQLIRTATVEKPASLDDAELSAIWGLPVHL